MHPCTPSIIFEWTESWLAVSQFSMCKHFRTICCSLHFVVYVSTYFHFNLGVTLIELFFHQSYFCWSSKLQAEMLEHGLYYSSHTQYFWLNTCPWIRKPIEYNRSYIHLLFLWRKSWYVIQSLSFSWINTFFWRWSWIILAKKQILRRNPKIRDEWLFPLSLRCSAGASPTCGLCRLFESVVLLACFTSDLWPAN